MNNEKPRHRQLQLSDAMIGILIPIFGYYLAARYEVGYCLKLNIPTYLIDIDIIHVINFIAIFSSIFLFVYFIYYIIDSLGILKKKIGIIIASLLALVLFLYFLVYARDLPWYAIFLVLIPLLFLIIVDLIKERISKDKVKKESDLQKHIFTKISEKYGIPSSLISLLIGMLIVAEPIGRIQAKLQTEFIIIKSEPELIALRKYSKKFVCAPFDREKKEVQSKFYLKSLDQIANEGLQLVEEKIGPLKVAKNEKVPTKKEEKEVPKK